MSLQNLAASANLQLFSKALQESAQQAGDNPTDAQQHQQNPAISAADLQQFMLSQLDQQLYLSQLARFGTATADPLATSSILFPSAAQQPQTIGSSNNNNVSESMQQHSNKMPNLKSEFVDNQNGIGTAEQQSENNSAMAAAHQFLPQNLMEQFLEAAAAGNAGGISIGNGGNPLELPNCQQQSADELNQLMAQLVNGCAANGMELQAQLLAAAAAASAGAAVQPQQQQEQQLSRGDIQSPLQQAQQLGLIDQLQLLQMLTGSGAVANGNVPGLTELLAAGISLSTQNGNAGSNEQQQPLGQFGQKSGHDGGSPNNKEAYCEICNKKLCNRYFLRTHMAKKHGIGVDESNNNKSPLKLYNGPMERIFFNQNNANNGGGSTIKKENQQQQHIEEQQQQRVSALPGRSFSMSNGSTAHHQQQQQQSDLSTGGMNYQTQKLTQKQSICSTPGLGLNTAAGGLSMSGDSLTAEQQQQLMSQCIMQQLASQLGLPSNATASIEQFLGGNPGLPLADLFQQQQQQNGGKTTPPPQPGLAHSPRHPTEQQPQQPTGSTAIGITTTAPQQIPCAHCSKQFPSQATLFQHQLSDHIGNSLNTNTKEQPTTTTAEFNANGTNEEQQQNNNNNNMTAMRWAAMNGVGGTEMPTTAATMGGQPQQLLGQLMGSTGLGGQQLQQQQQLMPNSFGGINPMELDGAAMLAKLTAELSAVSQGQNLLQTAGGISSLIGAAAAAAAGTANQQNKPPPQKRQYSSTSKNFCDLCNKEVCNKYFLRTHMFKMHNIVIDENKATIANIDTVERERKGEVKFRCNLCKTNMLTREQLKAHKREVHGMQQSTTQMGGELLMTSPHSSSKHIGTNNQMETAGGNTIGVGGTGAMETTTGGSGEQQKLAFLASSLGIGVGMTDDGEEQQRQQMRSKMSALPDNGSDDYEEEEDYDEEGMERDDGEDNEEEDGEERETESALPTSVKQLLCQLIGDPLLASARISTENSRKESKEQQKQQQQQGGVNEWQQHNGTDAGQQLQQQNGTDANNNISCRFCGHCIEGEAQLELHQLTEHSAELLALIQSAQQQQQQQTKEQTVVCTVPSASTEEDKLVTEVAMQMAEANRNSQQQQQMSAAALRKSSAASSSSSGGASSTYASSSIQHQHQIATVPVVPTLPPLASVASPQSQPHPCAQCKRTYKSAQKLEQHQRIVHSHNFVAKISPSKRPIVISPKKKNNLLKAFTCVRCQQRFGTRLECNKHVISVHIETESAHNGMPTTSSSSDNDNNNINWGNPSAKRARMEERVEQERQQLLAQWVREERAAAVGMMPDDGNSCRDAMDRLMVDEQEEENGPRQCQQQQIGNNGLQQQRDGGIDDNAQQHQQQHKHNHNQHPLGIELMKTGMGAGMTIAEKHSHTSGSTSPVSVHASSSSCGGGPSLLLPEGFAHPSPADASQQKPFVLQSFTIRPIPPPPPSGIDADNDNADQQQLAAHGLPDELIAYLPVRCTLTQPIRVTFELQPNPLLDAQVRHL